MPLHPAWSLNSYTKQERDFPQRPQVTLPLRGHHWQLQCLWANWRQKKVSIINMKYRPTWSEGSLSAGNMPILGTLILRAAAIFLSLWNSFLATFSFLSADLSANLSTKGSAFSGISNTQSFSLSAAARLNPYSGTHFCNKKTNY